MVENSQAEPPGRDLIVNSLPATDLGEADRIFRIAFGTFLGLPNPMEFSGDADYIRTRWIADPSAAFGAYLGNELVGSNFATRWGSVAFFGPRYREAVAWTDPGPYGELGREARRAVYVCP